MQVQAYLSFEGRTEEALEFYKTAIGAEVKELMRHSDSPEPAPPGMLPPGSERKVMHSSFTVGDTTIMATDGMCSGKAQFGGISLALSVGDAKKAERVFAALAEGGEVRQPLVKTFFSPALGMVADRFGVPWMVVAAA